MRLFPKLQSHLPSPWICPPHSCTFRSRAQLHRVLGREIQIHGPTYWHVICLHFRSLVCANGCSALPSPLRCNPSFAAIASCNYMCAYVSHSACEVTQVKVSGHLCASFYDIECHLGLMGPHVYQITVLASCFFASLGSNNIPSLHHPLPCALCFQACMYTCRTPEFPVLRYWR